MAVGLFVIANSASAAFITGSIGFSSAVGASWSATGGTGVADATGVIFNANPAGDDGVVTLGDGDYSGTLGSFVDYNDFTFAAASGVTQWSFTDSGGIVYTLVMNNANVAVQNNNLISLQGSGILTATGFEDTLGQWSLSLNRNVNAFTFSSSAAAVPEPGVALLLGIGLLGMGLTRKMRKLC